MKGNRLSPAIPPGINPINNMKDLTEIEMSGITGGTVNTGDLLASMTVGGIGGGLGAATGATTLAALAVPIACGALVGLVGYLVKQAVVEGVEAAKAVNRAYF